MAQKNYDIEIDQGEKFGLYFEFTDDSNNLIDLNTYSGSMELRKFAGDDKILVHLSGSGPTGMGAGTGGGQYGITGGGSTGFFSSLVTGGTAGTGGIFFNSSSTGSVEYNATGGVFISMDSITTSNIPFGRHFYDLEFLNSTTNDTIKVLKGRFVVNREVTKN